MKNGYGDHFKKLKAAKGLSSPLDTAPTKVEQVRQQVRERNRRIQKLRAKKAKFPIRLVVICVLGAGIAAGGMAYHEQIDLLISKVEVNFLGEARAESSEASAKAKPAAEAKAGESGKAGEKDVAAKVEGTNEKAETSDEIDHFLKLTERKKFLDVREEELNRQEAELQKQREEIEKKLKLLEETRNGISTVLQERAVKDSEKVDTLVQMYSNMKPSQAAKVLESMDEDLAVEIVGRMKKKNAAEVMNLMKSEKAQVFSEKYAGYRKR